MTSRNAVRGPMRIVGTIALGVLAAATWTSPAHAQPDCRSEWRTARWVDEDVGHVRLTLENHRGPTAGQFGNASGSFAACEGSFEYETVAGSAKPGEDYVPASGRVTISGAASIEIEILDDSRDEPDEAFQVRLLNPEGDFESAPEPVTIEIDDNDVAQTTVAASEQGGPQAGTERDASSQAAEPAPASDDATDRSSGWTLADAAPPAEGVAIAGEIDDVEPAGGWTAGATLATVLSGGLVLAAVGSTRLRSWVTRSVGRGSK